MNERNNYGMTTHYYGIKELHRVMGDVEEMTAALDEIVKRVDYSDDSLLRGALQAAVINLDKAIEIHQRS